MAARPSLAIAIPAIAAEADDDAIDDQPLLHRVDSHSVPKTPLTARRTAEEAKALAMHACVERRDVAGLRALLGQCVTSPMPAASAAGNVPAIDRQDADGFTALHNASALPPAESDVALELCRALVECGADASVCDADGFTCLHWSAAVGAIEIVRFLGRLHGIIEARSREGETALHRACRLGRTSVAEALVTELGAEPCALNDRLETPLEVSGRLGSAIDTAARDAIRAMLIRTVAPLRVAIYHHPECLEHHVPAGHQEAPARLGAVLRGLGIAGPPAASPKLPVRFANHPIIEGAEGDATHDDEGAAASTVGETLTPTPPGARQPFARDELELIDDFVPADLDTVARAHSTDYVAFLSTLCDVCILRYKQTSHRLRADDLFTPRSGEAAIEAAGAGPIPFTPRVQSGVMHVPQQKLKAGAFSDTMFSKGSLGAALRACGAVCAAVDRVVSGRNRTAFCVVRPPGHHAGVAGLLSQAQSCGFCLLNSVAVAATHALATHAERGVRRVAIVDIDVHHGNGTEEIVKALGRPDQIFFASVHLYDKSTSFYPCSGGSDLFAENCMNLPVAPLWKHGSAPARKQRAHSEPDAAGGGTDPGNSHAASAGAGRAAWRRLISQRLLFALRAFQPDLILMSTGFDGCRHDVGNKLLGNRRGTVGLDLRPDDFEWVTAQLRRVADLCCQGRLVSVLEGGYGTCDAAAVAAANAAAAAAASAAAAAAAAEAAAVAETTAGAAPTASSTPPVLLPPLRLAQLGECALAHVRGLAVKPFLATPARATIARSIAPGGSSTAASSPSTGSESGTGGPSPRRTRRRSPPRTRADSSPSFGAAAAAADELPMNPPPPRLEMPPPQPVVRPPPPPADASIVTVNGSVKDDAPAAKRPRN